MTREQAIKEVYGIPANKKQHEALQILIPELKESEDERIRKELLEEIEFIIPHDDETDSEGLILPSYHARIDRYKSYLEKQKEQSLRDFIDDFPYSDEQKEQKPVDFPTTDEEVKEFLETHPKVEVPEKYKTPDFVFSKQEYESHPIISKDTTSTKPIVCIDFDNEFENQVSHLIASVLNGEWEYDEGFVKHAAQSLLGYAKNEMKPDEWDKREKLFRKALQAANARIGQLFEENQKLKEQKPEWSEEDRIMLNDIIRCLPSKSSAEFNQKRVNWLKSLPERFNLQPKQKWSEEDEKTINDACCWIAEYAGYLMDKNYGKASMLMGLTDKLKSIRPSWKPTEEQMGALDYAYGELFKRGDVGHNILGPLQKLCDECRRRIKELSKQIKKS